MAPTTPNYDFIESIPSGHWSAQVLTFALGFTQPAQLNRLLGLSPQRTSWQEFRASFLNPIIANAPDPDWPYRGIGRNGGNYNRPRVNLVMRQALHALENRDFGGYEEGEEKEGWQQIDHYTWFVYCVVRKNRHRGRIWRNEPRERDAVLARLAFEILDYLVCQTLYGRQDFRPGGGRRAVDNGAGGDGGDGRGDGGGGGGGGDGNGRGGGGGGGHGNGGNGGGHGFDCPQIKRIKTEIKTQPKAESKPVIIKPESWAGRDLSSIPCWTPSLSRVKTEPRSTPSECRKGSVLTSTGNRY